MTDFHLSDPQAQHCAQYPAAEATAHAHLLACASCRRQVAVYQALFQDVAASPRPAFEAELRARVLAHLPATRPRSHLPWMAWLMSALLLGFVVGAIGYFGPVLGTAVAGVAPGVWTALLAGVGLLLLAQGLELLVAHTRQLRAVASWEELFANLQHPRE